jgi:hypothetical protein
MDHIRAIVPIEEFRPGTPIKLRAPTTLDELEAGIAAARSGAYTIVSRDVAGQAPYNAVIRQAGGGDYLAQIDMPEDQRPDPDELLSLPRAAALAGLGTRTVQTSIRRGNLPATKLVPGAREWFIRRGDLHRYLMGRRRGTPALLPADYVAPRGMEANKEGL